MLALLSDCQVAGPEGKRCSIEERTELAENLRLVNLTASGMNALLLEAGWLNMALAANATALQQQEPQQGEVPALLHQALRCIQNRLA